MCVHVYIHIQVDFMYYQKLGVCVYYTQQRYAHTHTRCDSPSSLSPNYPTAHIQDNPVPKCLCSLLPLLPRNLSLNSLKTYRSCQFKCHLHLLHEFSTKTPANRTLCTHIFQLLLSLFIFHATQSSSNLYGLTEFANCYVLTLTMRSL